MGPFLGIDVSTLPTWGNLLIFVVMVVIIAKGAGWFVEGATGIGRRMGISDLVLGLTVVALGTSAPEFAVSITAAMQGKGDIAVSNVVGSNVFNLGIILGACALFKALPASRSMIIRDGGVLLLGAIASVFLIGGDLTLDRLDGIILLSTLTAYLLYLIWLGKRSRRVDLPIDELPETKSSIWVELLLFAVGLAMILLASRFLVDSATSVARDMGVSEWIIGVTIVAAGTSSPELATSLVAASRGKADLGVGALIGSDIFNLFGVMGVSGVIHPIGVAPEAQWSLISFAAMVLLVLIVMRTGYRISRMEGLILIGVALVRWALDIFASPGAT